MLSGAQFFCFVFKCVCFVWRTAQQAGISVILFARKTIETRQAETCENK